MPAPGRRVFFLACSSAFRSDMDSFLPEAISKSKWESLNREGNRGNLVSPFSHYIYNMMKTPKCYQIEQKQHILCAQLWQVVCWFHLYIRLNWYPVHHLLRKLITTKRKTHSRYQQKTKDFFSPLEGKRWREIFYVQVGLSAWAKWSSRWSGWRRDVIRGRFLDKFSALYISLWHDL